MSSHIFARTEAIINIIARMLGYIGIGVLVVMMLLTVADVFMRYVFNRPILGVLELTQVMLVTIAFCTLVWCTMLKGHLKVDLLSKYISLRNRTISDSVYHLIGVTFYFLISWQNYLKAIEVRLNGRQTEFLDIPIYPFYFVVSIACGIVALVWLLHLVQHIILVVRR